jgi:shikimate kinase
MNLVLIGLRGTGKTTVARLLAERLGWAWFDADSQIEARAGKTIAAIFAEDGEPAFRDLESQVVAELAEEPSAVIALGGGAVVREENRRAIAAQGRVVWLVASPRTLLGRIEADNATAARRPNLSPEGGITEITATLDARRAIYRSCAHLEMDTEGKTPAQVADAILEELRLGSV